MNLDSVAVPNSEGRFFMAELLSNQASVKKPIRSLHFHHPCVSCDSAARHIKQTEGIIMKCGKLTAKLRDAVPVCFIENGKEVKRFKNIEIPDEIKKLLYQDFEFSMPVTEAITFKITFEEGVLPKVWPETRVRKIRLAKKEEMPVPETITSGL